MKVLVTGAAGFVGIPLCIELAEKGLEVHALVRNSSQNNPLQHPGIRLIKGDLLDPASLHEAVQGCDQVYHLAAFTGVWSPDPSVYHRVNVGGTEAVLQAALKAGVKRVVITSTAGVIGPSPGRGIIVDEQTNAIPELSTEYERTKLESERLAFSYLDHGLEVVIVNPSRVFGKGWLRDSNSVTRLIRLYDQGKWRFVPGDGQKTGNYVHVGDVVRGHLLAMERGRPGQRYILGGENLTYNEFFSLLGELTGKRRRMIHLPLPLMMAFARFELRMAEIFGKKPLIVPDFVRKYTRDWPLSSAKAEAELGYTITPAKTAFEETLRWVRGLS